MRHDDRAADVLDQQGDGRHDVPYRKRVEIRTGWRAAMARPVDDEYAMAALRKIRRPAVASVRGRDKAGACVKGAVQHDDGKPVITCLAGRQVIDIYRMGLRARIKAS